MTTGGATTAVTGTDFFLLDDVLTGQERAVRDRVRAFGDAEVLPVINDYWQREAFPHELVRKLAALRVAGGTIVGYGCPGMTPVAAAWSPPSWRAPTAARARSTSCTPV